MGHGIRSFCIDHDGSLQVEVPDAAVRRGDNFVAKAEVEGQVRRDVVIILNESGQVPIARRILTLQGVLFEEAGNAHQQVGEAGSTAARRQVGGVLPAETEPATRRRGLEEVPLLAPEVNAKFQRVLAAHPAQGVGNLEDVFDHEFRSPKRVAQALEARNFDERQARGSLVPAVGIGDPERLREIFAEVERQAGNMVPEEAPMKVVQQGRAERVRPAGRPVLGPVLGVAWAADVATQISKGARAVTVDIPEAVVREELVRVTEAVIETDIEGILVIGELRVQAIVVEEPGPGNVGQRIEIRDVLPDLVDHRGGDDVILAQVRKLVAEGDDRVVGAGEAARRRGIEDGSLVERRVTRPGIRTG